MKSRAEWFDLLQRYQSGKATCRFVMDEIEAERASVDVKCKDSLKSTIAYLLSEWNGAEKRIGDASIAQIRAEIERNGFEANVAVLREALEAACTAADCGDAMTEESGDLVAMEINWLPDGKRALAATPATTLESLFGELGRVCESRDSSGVKRLVDSHLILLGKLNAKDRPAGFDSWDAYHAHVVKQGAELVKLRGFYTEIVEELGHDRVLRELGDVKAQLDKSRESTLTWAESSDHWFEKAYNLETLLVAHREILKRCRHVVHHELTFRPNEAAESGRDLLARIDGVLAAIPESIGRKQEETFQRREVEMEKLRKDSARLDWIEQNAPLAIWRGTWSELTDRSGTPIISISEMDEDGNEVTRELANCENLRASIDNVRAKQIARDYSANAP